ncbi:DUF6512 family protein [Anaeromicropila herbilytica]|uniref:Uncharacterized protein n=1 Tax=Anaeromicropila herbilytica TaxID=2785025 RepID=A0A7R7EIP6_9FIRM|nr:DUF6512 family protein [Anaeromicropila herbilytica]BCN29488.1 hypothetical protein bsdtb5_07830 [Anaeromicropila herbilytica]
MRLKCWHIIGAIFTIIVGTLLHFTYEWSGNNPVVALFSPVNESTWEHLKLIFVPMLLFTIIEYFVNGKEIKNFIPVKVFSILLGMLTIVVSFYTYTGIIGQNYLVADIGTFILGVLVAYYYSYRTLQTDRFATKEAIQWSLLILIILCATFVIFTYRPPHIALFQDPNTLTYGK